MRTSGNPPTEEGRDIPPPLFKANFGAISSWANSSLPNFINQKDYERLGNISVLSSFRVVSVLDLRTASLKPLTQQRAIGILDTLSHDSFARLAASNMCRS